MKTVDNNKKDAKVLGIIESYGKNHNDGALCQGEQSYTGVESIYHINRHVLYY